MKETELNRQREIVRNIGEIRLHMLFAKSGMCVTARLWHYDGPIVTRAHGCGYDRLGTVMGNALCMLLPALVLAASAGIRLAYPEGDHDLYGLSYYEGKACIDGACGVESVVAIAKAMGWATQQHSVASDRQLVIFTREA